MIKCLYDLSIFRLMVFIRTVKIFLIIISIPILSNCNRNSAFHTDETLFDTTVILNISFLDLSTNKIPDSIFQMQNLKELSIWGMPCDDSISCDDNCWRPQLIPTAIKNLQHLEKLEFVYSDIHSIPIELTELKNLKYLELTNNIYLTDLDNISKMDNLEVLGLNGCNISKVPGSFSKLRRLEILGLTRNNLNDEERERIIKALPDCQIFF